MREFIEEVERQGDLSSSSTTVTDLELQGLDQLNQNPSKKR